ncbi:MAG: SRPBCC domain-containing protein [Actinomycetota bacterium]
MLIENSFEVPASIDVTWAYLLDVEKVVPCMPGAEITEVVDDSNWKGKVTIKLGPVSMSFKGKVSISERDDDAHKVVLKGSGMEQRGKGAASATITTTAEKTTSGTKVVVVQDLKVQGQAAQMSRGMMQDVSAKLTRQFADCLKANLQGAEEEPAAPPAPAAEAAPGAAAPSVPEPQAAVAARSAPPQGAAPESGPERSPAPEPAGPRTEPQPAPAPKPRVQATAKPVGGFSLMFSALMSALKRQIGKLFGKRS